ncbi:hypothetical protein [Bradyrhizobium guangzhouense]|uniref:hypothetical protein n=1 Tax=Bradyrhizobium guangzhouense TaxID=1325095 RepID=UPI001009EE70|nr:hypothetical protein [Bradyrhizobium guangzhouense]
MRHQMTTSESSARLPVDRGFAERRDVVDHQLGRPEGRGAARTSGHDGANPEVALGQVAISEPDGALLCRIADLRYESGRDADTDLIVNSVNFAAVRFEPRGSVQ